jgi:hypothetical protein
MLPIIGAESTEVPSAHDAVSPGLHEHRQELVSRARLATAADQAKTKASCTSASPPPPPMAVSALVHIVVITGHA